MSHNSEGRFGPNLIEEIRVRYAEQLGNLEPEDLSPWQGERVIMSLVRFLDTLPTDKLVQDSLNAASIISSDYRQLMDLMGGGDLTVLALPPEGLYEVGWTSWLAHFHEDAYPFRADVRRLWGI